MKNYPNVIQSFGITGIIIFGMLLFSPVNLLLSNLIGKEASMLIYYFLAVGMSFLIVNYIKKKKTVSKAFNFSINNKRIIPLVIIGTIALHFGISSPIGSLIPMPESVKKMFMDVGSQTGFFSFILVVIVAPILEELIFRGIILNGLLKKHSPIKSILISSFLFGVAHLNPWQFVAAFIVGVFSGWIYYKTRSLSLCIIIHASANFGAFLIRYFIDIESLMNNSLLQMYGGLTNLILSIVVSILIVSICIYFLKKEFNK